MIAIWIFGLLGSSWIVAWYLGTQAAIAGAVVVTLSCAGVAIIYLIIDRCP